MLWPTRLGEVLLERGEVVGQVAVGSAPVDIWQASSAAGERPRPA
ncbi:hypothetical protein ATKI12_4113 [Kitasatospora sp. Ki12]